MDRPKKTFYNGIDTWRGLAAMMVCIYHFSMHRDDSGYLFDETSPIRRAGAYGYLGVYIFFVISGFLIPLSMRQGGYGYRKIGKFLAKRSLRIEPPYIMAVGVYLALHYYLARLWGLLPYHVDPLRLLGHVFYVVPFVEGMEWYDAVYWTLAIEFQFYLLCALLYPLWTHRLRWVRHFSLLLFLFSVWCTADQRFVTYFAAIFGWGISLSLYRSGVLDRFEFALYVLLCGILSFGGTSVEIGTTAALAFVLLMLPDFRFRPGIWLGKISYSLYLIHGLAGGTFLMFHYRGDRSLSPVYFLAALGISVSAATLFYLVVEKPFHSLSRKMKL